MFGVFGAENYCGEIIWKNSSKNDQDYISMQHEYIVIFVKNKNEKHRKNMKKPDTSSKIWGSVRLSSMSAIDTQETNQDNYGDLWMV